MARRGAPGPLCASSRGEGRFEARACGETRAFACVSADGTWAVSAVSGPWSSGLEARPATTTFAVPRTAVSNRGLTAAKEAAGVTDVWLRYDTDGAGEWIPGP